jgi:hypothetical protein
MREAIGPSALMLVLLGAFVVAGCVLPPAPGTPAPPDVRVLGEDARAAAYGRSAVEIFEHPAIRDKVRALFGPDWGAGRPGGISAPARSFFEKAPPSRMVRVGDCDYVTVIGCGAAACAARRGLVLVVAGGEHLLARLDDGGFTHDYGFGPGMTTLTPVSRLVLDAAWRAFE